MTETQNKNVFEKYFLDPLGKMSQTDFVQAIMNTGMAIIPFTIIGSMFLVLDIVHLAFPVLEGFYNAALAPFSSLYMIVNVATMGILALYFCILMGYYYTQNIAQSKNLELSPVNGALLSLMAFILTIPQLVWGPEGMERLVSLDEGAYIINGWAMGDGPSRLGTVGIFIGIVMAAIAVHVYAFLIKRNISIRMPEEVPAGVARAFSALVPTAVVAILVTVINGVLIYIGYDFFEILQIPFGFVTNLASSWIGMVVIIILIHALWFVGIHGATIVTSLVTPIILANMEANAGGAAIPLAGEFWNAYAHLGGSGATLGFTFYIAFRAKSAQLSAIGKAAMVPALFNINEPIIFGTPMIYNPVMLVPWILAPVASGTLAYFATSLGFVKPLIAQQPWPTPLGLGAFIGTGGDWRAAVLAILCALVAFLVYYPFILKYDKQLVEQELANAAEIEDDEDDDDFFSL